MELSHYFFADNPGWNLFFAGFAQIPLQIIDEVLNGIHADIQLLTGALHSLAYLGAAENFPAAVLFDDHDGDLFDVLIGSKSTGTFDTLPATTNDAAVLADPGIDHLVIELTAKRTLHGHTSDSLLFN